MIPDLHPRTRETRAAVAGKLPPFTFAPVRSCRKWKMAKDKELPKKREIFGVLHEKHRSS